MRDVRWFAPNAFATLIVPRLQQLGLTIATEGDEPARLAVAMSGTAAERAWRYARKHGCPYLLYIWDLPPWRLGTGHPDFVWWGLGRFFRLPPLRRRYRQSRGYYSRLRFMAARARAVWAPSRASVESVTERFGVDCAHVPYCYDSSRFVPLARGTDAPPRSPYILTVSRLEPSKNQQAVLRAAAELSPALPVHLIGWGSEEGALRRLAAELAVDCSFASGLSDADVVTAYRQASVVVCPSRFEGFGLSPIEATACGTRVVASDIAPHREFVGRAARFFSLDDVRDLVTAIRGALAGSPPDPAAVQPLTIPAAAERFAAGLTTLL
ncbi:MAG TPA: glycosyltransferase [Gemmatimonadales bacterium]|nr:glycosyltransferase [Gemmatimonadales bacterium]